MVSQIEIVVKYNTPHDEFDKLCQLYPTGGYNSHGTTRWFRVFIEQIELTWFVER